MDIDTPDLSFLVSGSSVGLLYSMIVSDRMLYELRRSITPDQSVTFNAVLQLAPALLFIMRTRLGELVQ